MIKPLQKLCGTRHEVRELCPKGICPAPRSASPVLDAAVEYVEEIVAASKLVGGEVSERREKLEVKPTKLVMPAFSSKEDLENAKKLVSALTSAERSKAYRERHADQVCKRDRERKQRKRDG